MTGHLHQHHHHHRCVACDKTYSTKHSLAKHWTRQPLCKSWIELRPGNLADAGNLPSRHVEGGSAACRGKWAAPSVYQELCEHAAVHDDQEQQEQQEQHSQQQRYASVPPRASAEPDPLVHILWNLFLTDKISVLSRGVELLRRAVEDNNIRHIVAILPEDDTGTDTSAVTSALDAVCCNDDDANGEPHTSSPSSCSYHVLRYAGHDERTATAAFDEQCRVIERHRARRENVLLFCNSGYQRSLPFLCYFLTRHHADEAPDVGRAVDLVLPYVDRTRFSELRDGYVASVTRILETVDAVCNHARA
jgi:hypothetical protein